MSSSAANITVLETSPDGKTVTVVKSYGSEQKLSREDIRNRICSPTDSFFSPVTQQLMKRRQKRPRPKGDKVSSMVTTPPPSNNIQPISIYGLDSQKKKDYEVVKDNGPETNVDLSTTETKSNKVTSGIPLSSPFAIPEDPELANKPFVDSNTKRNKSRSTKMGLKVFKKNALQALPNGIASSPSQTNKKKGGKGMKSLLKRTLLSAAAAANRVGNYISPPKTKQREQHA
eukprot:g3711.t1